MSEWHKSIVTFHKLDNADNPESRVLGSPANAASIAECEKAVGHSMPEEFKTLYSEYDRFGTTRKGEIDWFFLPLSKLPGHATEVRDGFQETHPEIAKRFVPSTRWLPGYLTFSLPKGSVDTRTSIRDIHNHEQVDSN